MLIVRGIIGGILLFLGRELNFIFAGAMAGLIGFRLTPLLPAAWPAWADAAFMITLGLLAAILVLLNERFGYVLSGFLAGGFFAVLFVYRGFGIAAGTHALYDIFVGLF